MTVNRFTGFLPFPKNGLHVYPGRPHVRFYDFHLAGDESFGWNGRCETG